MEHMRLTLGTLKCGLEWVQTWANAVRWWRCAWGSSKRTKAGQRLLNPHKEADWNLSHWLSSPPVTWSVAWTQGFSLPSIQGSFLWWLYSKLPLGKLPFQALSPGVPMLLTFYPSCTSWGQTHPHFGIKVTAEEAIKSQNSLCSCFGAPNHKYVQRTPFRRCGTVITHTQHSTPRCFVLFCF